MHRDRLAPCLALLAVTLASCPDKNQKPPELQEAPAATTATQQPVAPADEAQARELADPVARAEIARVELEHRKDDPAVELAWDDYTVTVTEKPEHFVVFYQYTNPDPGFELWAGHGMHFNVYVDKKTGETRMIGGE